MSLLFSIVNSARNWVDSLQSMVPGYRDRIAHIYLDSNEGGLNLTMPIKVVSKVADYGYEAGEKLVDRFAKGVENGKPTTMNWENHRWIRYRSLMATLSAFLSRYRQAYEQPEEHDPSYLTLINRGTDGVSYPLTPEQVECAAKIAVDLDRLSKQVEEGHLDLHSPRPEPTLRVRPQFLRKKSRTIQQPVMSEPRDHFDRQVLAHLTLPRSSLWHSRGKERNRRTCAKGNKEERI
jgi:hypothetical protein